MLHHDCVESVDSVDNWDDSFEISEIYVQIDCQIQKILYYPPNNHRQLLNKFSCMPLRCKFFQQLIFKWNFCNTNDSHSTVYSCTLNNVSSLLVRDILIDKGNNGLFCLDKQY